MKQAVIRIAKVAGNGDSYSADQIIGKSLIARKPVKLKRNRSAEAETVYTVPAGQPVGVVYSYLGGNGSPLWWMFYDANKRAYYAMHEPGLFDIDALRDQGALSVEEETKKQKEKEEGNSSWEFPNPFGGGGINFGNVGKYVGLGFGVVVGLMLYNTFKK